MPITDSTVIQLRLAQIEGRETAPASCLAAMRAYHNLLLAMCDRLELIADTLPVPSNIGECRIVAQDLLPSMQTSHRFEEDRFFGAARLIINGGCPLEDAITRLCEEHREDLFFAEEICDEMRCLATGSEHRNAEVTGYMLRGFFGQMRRHIAFERDFLCIPMARRLADP
jgi:hypothetical protein